MHPTELRAHCISARRFGSDHVDLVALFAQCMVKPPLLLDGRRVIEPSSVPRYEGIGR